MSKKRRALKSRRQKPGRPTFGREALSVYVPFRCTASQRTSLEIRAKREGKTIPEIIRAALDRYFEH